MSNAGQWYHPRLVIKANISTLLLKQPAHKQISLVSLSLWFSFSGGFLFLPAKQSALCSISASLRSKTTRTYERKRPRKGKRRKGLRGVRMRVKRCYFLREQKKQIHTQKRQQKKENVLQKRSYQKATKRNRWTNGESNPGPFPSGLWWTRRFHDAKGKLYH